MENASRAITMAAGILIGVLILTLGAYLIVDLGSKSRDISKQIEQQRIVNANSKYTSYATSSDSDEKKVLTVYDIITILGYAKENNNYYEISEDEQKSNTYNDPEKNEIKVFIDSKNIIGFSQSDLLNSYGSDSSGNLKQFILTTGNIEYNDLGKVIKITFHQLR